MDALLAAARAAAEGTTVRVVIVATAAARQRPELAVRHGRQAFLAAAARAGARATVAEAPLLTRRDADAPTAEVADALAHAHLIHLPGGDPDLIAPTLRDTPAWAAILRALAGGACLAGASAGAMALGERQWTPAGVLDGLGLLPGLAVLPHFDARRLAAWRAAVDGEQPLAWLGLDEHTLVIGRPGGPWRVAGAGLARLYRAGARGPAWSLGDGSSAHLS